jgi:hypothetical protein
MAEINFNNLYNQLKPMEKRFYDQQFQKSYNPNQENIMLSSQPAYEQMKAVYDAQQQVPEESFLDKINIFGSASAAEMPQVPNLTYRNIDLPFDLRTGITNTKAALPFKTSVSEILNRYNVPNSGSQDLVNQLIAENQMKASQFDPRNIQSIFPTNFPSNIRQDVPLQNLGIDTSYGIANEPDVKQVDSLTSKKKSNGILDLIMSVVMPGYNFVKNIAKGSQPYEQFTPGGTIRNGIYNIDGVNVPVSSFGGDFYNPNTGLNRFDRARNRFNETRSLKDLFGASRTLAEFNNARKILEAQNKSGYKSDFMDRPKSERNYTGPGGGDNTGGDIGAKGAADSFSNKSGMGRTGY